MVWFLQTLLSVTVVPGRAGGPVGRKQPLQYSKGGEPPGGELPFKSVTDRQTDRLAYRQTKSRAVIEQALFRLVPEKKDTQEDSGWHTDRQKSRDVIEQAPFG